MIRRVFLYTAKVKFEAVNGGTYTEVFRVLADSESEAGKMLDDYFTNGDVDTGWNYNKVLSIKFGTSSDVIVNVKEDGKADIDEYNYLDELNN